MISDAFRITEDGNVYRGRFEPYELLGHIGSILHPCNRSVIARQVRLWWTAILEADEPIEAYVPPNERDQDPLRVCKDVLVVSARLDQECAA